MSLEHLLGMGFPADLAAQALSATGGDSVLKAADWILSCSNSNETCEIVTSAPRTSSGGQGNDTNTNPVSPVIDRSSSVSVQPKINHFFNFRSKPLSRKPEELPPDLRNETTEEEEKEEEEEEEKDSQLATRKRSKQQHPLPVVFPLKRTLPSPASETKSPPPPHEPLSERMRPRTVDEVVGQDHLLGTNSLLRSAIDRNHLPSILLWGPPGTGKTSLARAIANSTASSYRFVSLSAVTCGVKDVRDAVEEARRFKTKNKQKRTILFVDEVHRFNKSQQDSFLPVIEDGSIVFMGATTENPSFHLITPLLSRCRILTLNPLKPDNVITILKRASMDTVKGLTWSAGGTMTVDVKDETIEFLASQCDGDARVALNALEISAITAAARFANIAPERSSVADDDRGHVSVVLITLDDAKEALQCKHLSYDKAGEEHYNLISALHKSMRGNDADAAIYWLARMLEGGEQPLYIARRLIRFASEDVGLADPSALPQAVACYQACHFIGMPECNVNLAQCVAYMALAPKSVSVYRAIEAAQKVVRESIGQNEKVPLHLRNAPTKLMKELGYGEGYIYPPDSNGSSTQTYLPPSLLGYKFLDWPSVNSTE